MIPTITSTFNASAEGWTMNGDVASSGWMKTGGDPGGYFSWVDAATGANSYYRAPAAYLGKKGMYDGGTLAYRILDTGNGIIAYDVQLVGGGHTLQYTGKADSGFPTPNVWSAAKVRLAPIQFIDTATGAAPSAVEFRATLADLTELDIRAEYVDGAESGGLDDVKLAPPASTAAATRLVQASAAFDARQGAISSFKAAAHADASLLDLAPSAGGYHAVSNGPGRPSFAMA